MEPTIKLALARDISRVLSISANLGLSSLADEPDRRTEVSASASLGISLSDRLGMFTELYAFFYGKGENPDLHYFDAGITYLLTPDFQLDLRGGIRLSAGEPGHFFGIGAVLRL